MGIHAIKLPDVGEGVAEAEIVEWNVNVGDVVKEDDIIAAVMTDKATVEIPSPVDGKISALYGEIGEIIAVGSVIIELEVEGEGNAKAGDMPAPAKAEAPDPAPAPVAETKPKPKPQPIPVPQAAKNPAKPAKAVGFTRKPGDKPVASPAVRGKARDLGIDLRYVQGTGPAGRILHDDLDAYVDGKAAPTSGITGLVANTHVEDIKVIGMRRKIAEKMQSAKRNIPHFAYIEEVDVTELESLRTHLNASRKPEQAKLTILPFLMRALVKALKDYPQMSSRYDDQAGIVHQYGAAHIGIAAQTPQGLMVPVVKHAEARDIWDNANEVARLAEAARTGKATLNELTGSTITVTSLGPMGGIASTPVINAPEVAIIGVNKILARPMYNVEGMVVPRKMMNLSSSFDHRIIDGFDAASFIQALKAMLENPATLFMES